MSMFELVETVGQQAVIKVFGIGGGGGNAVDHMLSANLEEDVSADDVRPRVNSLMEQIELPPGYSWKEGRGFERQDETADMMATNIILGVACIFLVMAALFESLILPFSIILGSIVFSIFGVFLFFAATGTTFSFMAMSGMQP